MHSRCRLILWKRPCLSRRGPFQDVISRPSDRLEVLPQSRTQICGSESWHWLPMERHWLETSCPNTNLIRRTRDFIHLAMSPTSAIVPLSLLVSVSLAAELELEDGCLLQTKEQQLLVKEQLRVCDPLPQEECCCCELVTQPTGDTNLADCAASCTNYSGF